MYAYEVDAFEIYEVPVIKWTLARGEMRVDEP
jgi:hypothetical protein